MTDEKDLYQGCRDGDQRIMKELFVTYLPLFTGVCRRYAQNDHDAKDLVQEGFIKIFSSIHSFNWKGKGSFRAWMQRIMVNNAVDYCKKSQRNLNISFDSSESDFVESPEEDIEVFQFSSKSLSAAGFTEKDLVTILQNVPANFRVVFNMYVVEGKKHKEIADILGITEKTSTTRLTRARKLVRAEIEKNYAHRVVV